MKLRLLMPILCLVTLLALIYVQEKVVLVAEGYQLEELRRQRDEILDQHRVLQYNVLALQSPVILNKRLARQNVQLTAPQNVEVLQSSRQWKATAPQQHELRIQRMNWFQQAKQLVVGWVETDRQAEARPAIEGRD